MKRLFLIGILSFLSCGLTHAQDDLHPILSSASINADGQAIYLHWTIANGNTCNGIKIFRTSNPSLGYTEVGFIDGICGSTEVPTPYSFTDETPIENSINYYRISFGNQGNEDLQVEFVAIPDAGVLVTPNPMLDRTVIYFDNPTRNEFEFKLFDMQGSEAYSQSGIRSGSVILSRGTLRKGTYVFFLYDDNERVLQGKLVIL